MGFLQTKDRYIKVMSFFIKLLRNLKIRFFSPNLNPGSYLNE